MTDAEETNGHGRPAGESGANSAPKGNDYAKGNKGNTTLGPERPQWRHGLYSRWMSDEDEELMLQLEDKEGADKLSVIIDHMVARYVRSCQELDRPEMVKYVTDDGTELSELDTGGDDVLAERADVIRKLIKDHAKMTDGETINVNGAIEHTHQTDLSDEEREHLDELF